MKKFLIAILALVYLGTSTGATIHMHYCMGRLAGWGFGHKESKTCPKCGMEQSGLKGKGCCNDKHTFVKNTTDQKTAESVFKVMPLMGVALPVSIIEIPGLDIPSVTEENPISHAPPFCGSVPIYIFNCLYRI